MSNLFISHSSQDDAFVRELQQELEDHGVHAWTDSRQLIAGNLLDPEIKKAIEGASAFAVVVSPNALQSKWVGKELSYALEVQKNRGKDQYPVIPLSLNGTKLGVLETLFDEEPIYLSVSNGAGGVEEAMHPMLVALGLRKHGDVDADPQPQANPLEELVLELSDLKIAEKDGVRRASAHARLVYEPATPGRPHVRCAQSWRLIAPIGPIEAEELRWYLEKYAVWPSHYFRDRARKVEANLVKWGQQLHEVAMPAAPTENVIKAWKDADPHAHRRFSVQVDAASEIGAPDAEVKASKEAATLLLGLPWELLHDGKAFLFQGAKPTRVRRRLPGTEGFGVPVVALPIRILLVTARPEDDNCGYIDHRASALPLVEAMEALPGLVKIHVLSPPTLTALRTELDRARDAKTPYHVVHFDGHGVYDRQVGLGGLCFELPEDIGKLERRRHANVFTSELGPLLRDHRIPLVFLEACQTAQAEKASESVASELLKVGVASVVAMSHSVLVETARQFVAVFYRALADGQRVGDAMLAGQRQLKDDTFRGRVFGEGELRLEDWFVPVLFQEKEDPQLFRTRPAKQTLADFQTALKARLGGLPAEPETTFIGRSRELLALQRLLRHERYAVVRGQGGEGKTALAAEFARWMVRSHQMRRAAFVSVELNSNVAAVLDALGRQLVGKNYSVATFESHEKAILPVERALTERATLLVMDNMESILLPPFLETPEALSEDARRELDAILALCARLNAKGETRLIFTSREALPAPFDAEQHRRELRQLHSDDAVKLVERALNMKGSAGMPAHAGWIPVAGTMDQSAGGTSDAATEEIEQLVAAVHCHARTLALLAPALRQRGVDATRTSLVELMAEMNMAFPGSREKSVFASVELSLRRLSETNRDRARVLGAFHGGVQVGVLAMMMQWKEEDAASLAVELIETGLATPNRFNHLTLNPALCPYLRGRLESTERVPLTARWVGAMNAYVGFLNQQASQNAEVAAKLTGLELPNLFALLDFVQRAGDAEATIGLATSVYGLLQGLGKPRLVELVAQVRDAAAATMANGAWNHARFQAARTRIEQQLNGGQLHKAFEGAQQLLQRARTAGKNAYPSADYDLAMACFVLARVLLAAGSAEEALPLLDEARPCFEAIAKESGNKAAEAMASACLTEQGECLGNLGRLNEAAAAYEEGIRRDERRGADRDVAVGKGQLGTIRMHQLRYADALAAHEEARKQFTKLDEPGMVAVSWHLTGMVYLRARQPEAAEDAYRKSLAINVRLGNVTGQASTLGQLGNMYGAVLNRLEEAAAFYGQAADKFVESRDTASEGLVRNNLASTLLKLRRLDEARQEIRRAIECDAQFGHASEPWKTWAILANIETEAGNPVAVGEAKGKAIASYLAYRRAGGENHDGPGRLALAVTQSLLAGDSTEAMSLLRQLATEPKAVRLHPFVHTLQIIVTGSRDRTLAEAPALDYMMAAEILFLLETLAKAR
jgi:tetratricopeptide (TPR) repeat protein